MAVVGYVVWPRGRKPITDEACLWLGRSLTGETDHSERGNAAAAWVMISRMVYWLDKGIRTTEGMPCANAPTGRGPPEWEPVRRPIDVIAAIRCFSSPTNPAQLDRVPERQARRRFFITATWEQLEHRAPGIKDFVYRFARGEVPNAYPGAADFDAPLEVPAGAHRIAQVGGNVLMGEPGPPGRGTLAWPPDYVTIQPARGLQAVQLTPQLAVGIGLALAAVATVALAYKYTRNLPVRAQRRRRYQRYLARLAA